MIDDFVWLSSTFSYPETFSFHKSWDFGGPSSNSDRKLRTGDAGQQKVQNQIRRQDQQIFAVECRKTWENVALEPQFLQYPGMLALQHFEVA